MPAASTNQTGDWFSARLLYDETFDGERPSKPLYEEKIIVFRAKSATEAARHARQLGRKGNYGFKNVYGETVRWTFREILEIQEIMDTKIADGTEVFFRFWDNPGPMRFRIMRETHTRDWWTERRATGTGKG